jgi:hypothetical protein
VFEEEPFNPLEEPVRLQTNWYRVGMIVMTHLLVTMMDGVGLYGSE